MNDRIGFKDSYQPGNGYQFHCPVVARDALLVACWFIRAKHMKGQNEKLPNDCKCALRGSKCPADRMLKMEWQRGERLFHDAAPTRHMLPKAVVQAIERVALLPSHANGEPLTAEQSKRLFSDGIVVARVSGDAELPPTGLPGPHRAPRRAPKPAAAPAPADGMAALADAADMGAMLNKALGAGS